MNKIIYSLIATMLFIQTHNHYAAEVSQPAINDVYTRPLIVRAENGDSLELSPADLVALQSEYLKQLAAPEHELSVESIAVLPIATVRPLQLLLPRSQLAEAQYDDVVEATSLADLLVIPNGVAHFLKRLGRENIKLLCQLYQDQGLEGRELVKDYISPYIAYKLIQRLGAVNNKKPDVGHADSVKSVALSPDGNTIISGSWDCTAIIWHRGEDGQFWFNLHRDRLGAVGNRDPDVGHTRSVYSALLSIDGNTIISGSDDRTIIVWHRGEDGLFHMAQRLGVVNNIDTNPDAGHTGLVSSVVLSPDGNTIISGSYDHTLIAWYRGGDGQFRFNPQRDRLGAIDNTNDHPDVGHTDWVTSIALSPDGNTIISGSYDHTLIAWHRGGDGQFRFNPQRDRLGAVGNTRDHPDVGHTDWVTSIALSPDGNTIISGSNDHTLIAWHRGEDGQFRFSPQRDRLGVVNNTDDYPDIGHTAEIASVALSPDGNTIISGSWDHTIIVWHRGEDGQFWFNPQRDRLGVVDNKDADVGHTDWIRSVVLSSDGNTIISGSGDRTIIIWRKQSVDEFCAMQAQASEVGV